MSLFLDAKLTLQINGLHGVDIRPGFDPALLDQAILVIANAVILSGLTQ